MNYAVWYPAAIVFFLVFRFSSRLRTGLLCVFAGSCHRPAFFVVCWFVVPVIGSWYFHVVVFFSAYVESVAIFIKYVSPLLVIFIGGICMIPRFVDGRLLCRFLFPLAALSLEHCFARPFRSPAQAELTSKMITRCRRISTVHVQLAWGPVTNLRI